jgi:hypothetical protein
MRARSARRPKIFGFEVHDPYILPAYDSIMMNSVKAPSRSAARTAAIAALSLVVGYGGLPAQAASSVHRTPHDASPQNMMRGDEAGHRALLAFEEATEAIAEGETTSSMAVTNARKATSSWPTVRATLRQNGATARSRCCTTISVRAGLLHAMPMR